MAVARRSMKASGNISPSRFVKLTTTADGEVTQAGAGEQIYGISQKTTRRTPYGALDDGYAAIAGENVGVHGIGEECLLEAGGTVAPGDRLKSDASGKGVATTTNLDEWGAICLQAGTAGKLVRVEPRPGMQVSA